MNWKYRICRLLKRHRWRYRFDGGKPCSCGNADCSMAVFYLWCDRCDVSALVGQDEVIDYLAVRTE